MAAEINRGLGWRMQDAAEASSDVIIGCDLAQLIGKCVTHIRNYECDFFSAPNSDVSREDAERMLSLIIEKQLFSFDGTPGFGIDGGVIEGAYDAIREIDEQF